MSDAVDWVDNPGPARWFLRVTVVATLALVALNVVLFAWNAWAWSADLSANLLGYFLVAFCYLILATEVPVRVAVDGASLRVRCVVGERRVPLNEIVAADLAPGMRPGRSVLRLARRPARILGIHHLETPTAEDVASRLEHAGISVNRAPPPRANPAP